MQHTLARHSALLRHHCGAALESRMPQAACPKQSRAAAGRLNWCKDAHSATQHKQNTQADHRQPMRNSPSLSQKPTDPLFCRSACCNRLQYTPEPRRPKLGTYICTTHTNTQGVVVRTLSAVSGAGTGMPAQLPHPRTRSQPTSEFAQCPVSSQNHNVCGTGGKHPTPDCIWVCTQPC